MANRNESVNSIVSKLQSVDDVYVLPAIQRPYVWKESQIVKLFDSIMRNYPLGSLMVWRTRKDLSSREFKRDWKKGDSFSLTKDTPVKTKNVILDGQQRLQSLLIGMRGSYNGKLLYFNLLSVPTRENKAGSDDLAYEFKFFKKPPAGHSWIAVRTLSQSGAVGATKMARSIVDKDPEVLTPCLEQISENIEVFKTRLSDDSYLCYISIDETIEDGSEKMSEDDIVEIFVRSNNGGTKLNKSDLLFSLLSSKWEPAYSKLSALEQELAANDFDFGRDYILKATLMCIGEGAEYSVKKFKKPGVLEEVQKEWNSITKSFADVVSFLKSSTPVGSRKSLVSANSLLPLITMRSGMDISQWNAFDKRQAAEYILRTSLARSFSDGKDDLLDKLAASMCGGFDLEKVFGVLKTANRNIDFTSEKIWNISYKESAMVYFALSKVVVGIDFEQMSGTNIDHIIPKALLKSRDLKDVNQLANLTVLSEADNKSKGKKTLVEWLREFDEDTLKSHCERHAIPFDKSLWVPERFDDFIAARKKLIVSSTPLGRLLRDQIPDADSDGAEAEDSADEVEA